MMAEQPEMEALALLAGPVRDWFKREFPSGPTPAQASAWPLIAARKSLLLVSPTGTGKTLAAFLAIIDRLIREQVAGTLTPRLRCVYISPLRSLGYDVERNLLQPLDAIRQELGIAESAITIGVRTGDTSAYTRRKLRDRPPHILITTPESLSLLLSQSAWNAHWATVDHIIMDEIHALVPTKRGADLAVSVERLAAHAKHDPCRAGLSATCRPVGPVARFLVGPTRTCHVVQAEAPSGADSLVLGVEPLLRRDEAPIRGLTYRRLLHRIGTALRGARTTIVFANTRALTERITHDLRLTLERAEAIPWASSAKAPAQYVAAHHSALDPLRRREVEGALKAGELRAVVTSTSLELGVDIGTADLSVLVGLPGSTSRCLQRVGRAGHRVGAQTCGLILAATPAELAGAAVTARAAKEGRIEPLRPINAPLDVLCQQLIGMACGGEWSIDDAYELVRRSAPMAALTRTDFASCLEFLAGDLAAPAGAFEPEPGAAPRWTSPRLWRERGRFGVRSARVLRWFRRNVGTINSEETVRVLANGLEVGTVEAAYAERLMPGDRFILDGRSLQFWRLEGNIVQARPSRGDPELPRWSSDRQSLSADLARDLGDFREMAGRLLTISTAAFRSWLREAYALSADAAGTLEDLFAAQEQASEIPVPGMLLVEESPHPEGWSYAFHAPLSRSACEPLARAFAARLGRNFGQDLEIVVSDLGWSIRLNEDCRLELDDVRSVMSTENFADDVLEGLDRGDLLARRFRHVACTALMVLRNPEGGRTRVGGMFWVSQRLYPLVVAASPDHPLLRETRREVVEDLLDVCGALAWLDEEPEVRMRRLEAPSPFAAAWIDPGGPEPLSFESPDQALLRLHTRLLDSTVGAAR
jgi:ATP-dependent Lhr-like helicase